MMKKLTILAAALLFAVASYAQGEYNFQRRSLFDALPIHSNDIVFLGNSITDGCEWAELFNNRHIKNRGIGGDRSGWLVDRLDPILEGHPKRLFLMIGINDLAAGISPREVAANVRKIVERFQTESRWTKVFVQSVLPVTTMAEGRAPYAKAADIAETNRLLAALCEQMGVTYIDVAAALADHKGLLDKRYTNDGLHLLGEGYLVWRDVLKPYVK